MQPVIVMPMNDPLGTMFPHLRIIAPSLKHLFAHAVVSVSATTQQTQVQHVAWLADDPFFQVLTHSADLPVGRDFAALYTFAAECCHPQQVLHLCFIDRVAFALQTAFRNQFCADVQSVPYHQTPLIFQRSPAAWETHPRNYRMLEQFVTQAGMLLFQKSLDFAWCHLALTAAQLARIIPSVNNQDLSMVAELPLLLRDSIQTQDVDWLAWEDPFILKQEAHILREEREQSLEETRKRLSYVIPILELLYATTTTPC